jgi:hypothetical protein
MQIRLDFPAENAKNELMTLTAFGAILIEK